MKKIFTKRLILIIGLALIVLIAIFVSIQLYKSAKLPAIEIPDVNSFAIDARNRINKAYEHNIAYPDDPDANGELGRVLHQYRLHEFTGKAFLRAHLLQPDKFRWLYYLGVTQALREQNEVAINTYRKALEIRPKYVQVKFRIANILLNMGQTEEAIQMFLTALDEKPNFIRGHYNLGQAYRTLGDLQPAAEHFRMAIALFEQYGDAHYALGLVYRDLGELELAKKHLLDFENYEGMRPPAQDPLITALFEGYEGIQSRMQKVQKLAADGEIMEAISITNNVLEDRPDHIPAHITLITLYTHAQKYNKAVLHYRKTMQLNPNAQGALFYYAKLLLLQNRDAEAIEIFRKVIDINPLHAEALSNLGMLFDKQGDPEQAELFFKRAMQSDPNDPMANYNYGRYLLFNGQIDVAIELFNKVTSLQNKNAGLLTDIAQAFAEIDYGTMVISYYKRARDIATKLNQWKRVAEIERELCYWQN